ncbi:MAG: SUMF1/EgtB/PvdO family nonheme iron enzyme [Planctomycetales bacterium]|nr:SUMF1/EgtB/PvdO family nonheme iron enzyme [Planctomycetales bacterium]
MTLVLDQFEDCWQQGDPPDFRQFLEGIPTTSAIVQLMVEMVGIDLEHRWRDMRNRGSDASTKWKLDDYVAVYPELGMLSDLPVELVAEEYRVRQRWGDAPQADEYRARFAGRWEEIQAALSVVDAELRDEAGKDTNRSTPKSDTTPAPDGASLAQTPLAGMLATGLPVSLGRYKVLSLLGQGGMGTVFLAEDADLRRHVAIKVPQLSADASPTIRDRFLREARVIAALRHPNICPVYEVTEVDGTPCIVMAYIEGKPLSYYIRRSTQQDIRSALLLIRKVALALVEAHQMGVIHRDLKPANILIDRRKEPIVMDFGLARRDYETDTRLTSAGQIMGTPRYMPPEQVEGQLDEVGPAADIYSLGVVLYELVTGETPFSGSLFPLMQQIVTAPAPPPSSWRPDVDANLDAICLRALAKSPADRYASMSEFAAAMWSYVKLLRKGDERLKTIAPEVALPADANSSHSGREPVGGDASLDEEDASVVSLGDVREQAEAASASANVAELAVREEWSEEQGDVRVDTPSVEQRPTPPHRPLGVLMASGLLVAIVAFIATQWASPGKSSHGGTPTSSAPTSSAPTSSAPTSSAPTSSAPTSSAPTSTKPTSSTPATSEPATSELAQSPVPSQQQESPQNQADSPKEVPIVDSAGKVADASRFLPFPFTQEQAQLNQQAWAASLSVPVELSTSFGMKFRLIPPGEFMMGNPRFEEGDQDGAYPHVVLLTKPFYLAAHEVTVGQFRAFVEASGYETSPERRRRAEGVEGASPSKSIASGKGFHWHNTGFPLDDQMPVTNVSWDDASKFCDWLSQREQLPCKLPTEAQWEFALRAGNGSYFHSGEELPSLEQSGNIRDQSLSEFMGAVHWQAPWNDRFPFAAPVGRFPPNPFGLFDMHGNAAEWVQDEWSETYFRESPPLDPNLDPVGPTLATNHQVIRGTSWSGWRSGAHFRWRQHRSTGSVSVGFRVAIDATASALLARVNSQLSDEASENAPVRATNQRSK